MIFELLKVCRQANPAWIELQVMYVRSTVTDRHARPICICGILFFKLNGIKKLAQSFNFMFHYIDDVLSLNNSRSGDFVDRIYPIELYKEMVG
jgi:hypothetical protein